jgi:hypothetical protein
MERLLSPGALIAASLLLCGCAAGTPQTALLQSCQSYAAALQAASAAAVRGRLSTEQMHIINEITVMLNPICEEPPDSAESAAIVVGSVRKALETLLFLTDSRGAVS